MVIFGVTYVFRRILRLIESVFIGVHVVNDTSELKEFKNKKLIWSKLANFDKNMS
jgi:hypothetical protein